jgi:hypothetical protein
MRSAFVLLIAAMILPVCGQPQAAAAQDDEQPRYSSLDEVAGMSRELLNRPAPGPTAVIDEPPAAGCRPLAGRERPRRGYRALSR